MGTRILGEYAFDIDWYPYVVISFSQIERQEPVSKDMESAITNIHGMLREPEIWPLKKIIEISIRASKEDEAEFELLGNAYLTQNTFEIGFHDNNNAWLVPERTYLKLLRVVLGLGNIFIQCNAR
jgi:hypothetical protein